MDMTITFPGGARVDAEFGPYTIPTDQPPQGGGEGSAPAPFTLFLASIGMCAGIYVLGFCKQRGLPTDGIRLTEQMEFDEKHVLQKVSLRIHVPPSFPEKYREPVRRAAESCSVKKAIFDPPELVVETTVG